MRSGDAIIKIVSMLVFAALVLYIGFALLGSIFDSFETSVVSSVTIEDGIEISGYAVREEIVLSGDDTYVVVSSDGDKVSVGQPVAVKYSGEASLERAAQISELTSQIDQLEEDINGRKSHAELANESVYTLSQAISSGDMDDVQSAIVAIKTYIMGSNGVSDNSEETLAALKSQLQTLQDQSSGDTQYINAEFSGVFTSVTDGYETVTEKDLEGITPSSLSSLFQGKSSGPDAIGKIVTGIDWYYACVMDTEDAQRLSTGSTCDIQFSNSFSEELTMTVKYISADENGKTAVVFSSNKYVSDIASLRELTGSIMFDSYTGIAVPKNAVHYDEDGQAYVYVLAGLQARVAEISIVDEIENYYVVENQSGSLLRVGSEVITKGNDLYDGKVVQ